MNNGVAAITWNSAAGHVYRLQYRTSLNNTQAAPLVSSTGWTDIQPDVTAAGPTTTATNPITGSARFYRVMLVQ
jgi:hypothetical protein